MQNNMEIHRRRQKCKIFKIISHFYHYSKWTKLFWQIYLNITCLLKVFLTWLPLTLFIVAFRWQSLSSSSLGTLSEIYDYYRHSGGLYTLLPRNLTTDFLLFWRRWKRQGLFPLVPSLHIIMPCHHYIYLKRKV